MSLSDSVGTGSTDGSSTSVTGTCSFLVPRDPSITKPWMRPHPTRGTNLCNRFELDSTPSDSSVEDQHLKVYLRVKPTKRFPHLKELYYVSSRNSFVTIAEDAKSNRSNVKVKKAYNFTHIFDDSNGSQIEIFNHVIRDNLAKFVEGQDFTVMTYGASGSGKTYTLMGNEAEPGIIPRFLEALFARVQVGRLPNYKPQDGNDARKLNSVEKEKEIEVIQNIVKNCHNPNTFLISDSERDSCLDNYRRMSTVLVDEDEIWRPNKKKISHKYDVWVSFAEIYNENIFDLLREDSTIPNQQPNRLRLVHLPNNKSYIKGIRWVYVRNGEEAFAALKKGRCHLRYAHTNINKQSSRCHSIFFLKIVQYDSDFSNCTTSTFRLCDLAGSERAKKTGNEGVRLTESRMINSSLHVLERCLAALRSQQDGQQSLPPYRQSKLTSLLQNALCGNEAIAMMVNINPDLKFFDETQHVLQFSSIAKKIIGYVEPKKNEFSKSKSCLDLSNRISDFSFDNSFQAEVQFLNEEIERIKHHYEDLLEQKEKEVRQELMGKFMKMNSKVYDDFEIRLKNDRKIHAETHEWEMSQLRKEMESEIDDQKQEIKKLAAENCSLKEKLATLKKKENDADVTSTSEKQNDNSSEYNSIPEIIENEEVSSEPEEDLNECIKSDKENVPLDVDNLCVTVDKLRVDDEEKKKEKLCIIKEEKNPMRVLMNNEIQNVGSSKRKLFSRRQFDENAAESVLTKISTKLVFEEESPGAICPPKLEKPYAVPTSTRKQKK